MNQMDVFKKNNLQSKKLGKDASCMDVNHILLNITQLTS